MMAWSLAATFTEMLCALVCRRVVTPRNSRQVSFVDARYVCMAQWITIAGGPPRCADVIRLINASSVVSAKHWLCTTMSNPLAQSGFSTKGCLPVVPRPPWIATVQSTGSAFETESTRSLDCRA
jgi:hypothetical protein